MTETDHTGTDWNGKVLDHGPAQLEVRGVNFVFDEAYVHEDTFNFLYDHNVTAKIHRDDVPEGVDEWIGEITNWAGDVEEQ